MPSDLGIDSVAALIRYSTVARQPAGVRMCMARGLVLAVFVEPRFTHRTMTWEFLTDLLRGYSDR